MLTILPDRSVLHRPCRLQAVTRGIGPSGGTVNGFSLTLTAAPPDTANAYDGHRSGACSGDAPKTTVIMTQDQPCYVKFTPVSLQ